MLHLQYKILSLYKKQYSDPKYIDWVKIIKSGKLTQ